MYLRASLERIPYSRASWADDYGEREEGRRGRKEGRRGREEREEREKGREER